MTASPDVVDHDAVLYLMRVVWGSGTPELELRDGAGTLHQRRRVPAIGYRLHYRIDPTGPQACLGHVDMASGVSVECGQSPPPGKRRCDRCHRKDVAFSVNLHQSHTRGTSELDPAMVEHLRQPNVLYVAGFGDGSTKIGTSTERRWATRLAEQGAWRARIIARTDNGIAVRRGEDLVTTELGLPQAVSAARKLKGVTEPIGGDELADLIDRHAERAQHLVTDLLGAETEPLDTVWTNPAVAGLLSRDVRAIAYPGDITSGAHVFVIEVMIGRIALARRPDGDDLFAIDLGELYGQELAIGDWEPEEIAVQDSLFG